MFTDTNTFRAISSTPANGATTTSISSGWAYANVKTAVPVNALFTDTNTNTTYTASSGITLTGTNFTNSAPDRTVSLTGGGATTISGTYPDFTISSTDNNTNTVTSVGISGSQTTGTITIQASGASSVSQSGSTITISSTDTNTNTDTWRPIHDSPSNGATTTSISSNWAYDTVKSLVPVNAVFTDTLGASTAQASAITANTAKTSFPGFGTTSSTALAGNTSIPQGTVTTVQSGTSVNAISVSGGTSATVTLSAHATLEAIADGVAVSNLDVDFLKATTIVADKIDANEITMNKLKTAPVSGQGSVEIGTAGIRILDSSNVLRVAIGNLSRLATDHNNA